MLTAILKYELKIFFPWNMELSNETRLSVRETKLELNLFCFLKWPIFLAVMLFVQNCNAITVVSTLGMSLLDYK